MLTHVNIEMRFEVERAAVFRSDLGPMSKSVSAGLSPRRGTYMMSMWRADCLAD